MQPQQLQQQGYVPYSWLSPQFATWLASNIIAVLLSRGIIDPYTANQLNNDTALIGSIIIFVLMNALYLAGCIIHNLKYGPTPSLPTGAMPDSVSPSAPSGPASPSYGPPSTGPETTTALPAELAGVI